MSCGCNSVQAGGKRHGRKKKGGFDLSWLTGSQSSPEQSQYSMASKPSFFSGMGQSLSNLRSSVGQQFNNATRKLGSYANPESSGYISPSYTSGSSLPSYGSVSSYSRGGRGSRGGKRHGRKTRSGRKSRGGKKSKVIHTRKHRKH